MVSDLLYRLRALFQRNSMEAELDEELCVHLEHQVEKYVQSGMSRDEAKRRARIELGGFDQVKEECRDAWGLRVLNDVIQDVRFGLRMLAKNPGFAAVAMLTLALGIGANTAIFSLFYTIMLRTLPVAHPEQLVQLMEKYPGYPRGTSNWDWASYEYFRDNNHVFSGVTGMSFDNLASVRTDGSEPETMVEESVPGNYFRVLGLVPATGRFSGPEDVPPSGYGDVAVVSWSYWNSRFHRDPSILGRRIFVDDAPKTIIGVAPRAYRGPRVGAHTDIWVPREHAELGILARLRPGITLDQARAEISVLHRFTLERRAAQSKDPRQTRQIKVEVEPAGAGLARVRDQYGNPLVLLMAVAGLLLLLACINVASMLLARAAGRQKEIAVRLSMGAGRQRVLRQMLTESVLLSGMGTLLGILVAYAGISVLVRIIASGREFERLEIHVEPDLHLLLFTTIIALLTGLLFGMAPAWYAFRSAPASSLRHSGRGGEAGFGRLFGKGLVAAQVALSVLLVTAATLFLSHLSRLRHLDLGFHSDNVLLVGLDPARSGYKPEQLAAPYQELLARFERIPGVLSASICACTPIQGCGASRLVSAEGYAESPTDRGRAALSRVAPKYFETLRIPLIAGRDFTFGDAGLPRVAMISESMAQHYFSGGNPIGRHVTIDWDRDDRPGGREGANQPYEIVGVVGDAKYIELREPPPRTLYLNMFQEGGLSHQFELRTSVNPAEVAGAVRPIVRDVLITVPVTKMLTLSDQVNAAIVPERLISTLSEFFGALGAALAGIGLYGLLAYTVARRINEIGIRTALGASPGDIRRLVLGDALGMVCTGLLAGMLMVIWCRPLAASLVVGLDSHVARPLALGVAAILMVALLASYIPARRAATVDPMVALRYE